MKTAIAYGLGKGKQGIMLKPKRHQNKTKPLNISKTSIRRLARRGGVTRMSGTIYREIYDPTAILDENKGCLYTFLKKIIRDAITYTDYANRKTVTAMDVVQSLKSNGRPLYGFGG